MLRKLKEQIGNETRPLKKIIGKVSKSKEDYLAKWLISQTYHYGMAKDNYEQSIYNHFSIIKNPEADFQEFRNETIKQFDQIMYEEFYNLEIVTENSPAKGKEYEVKTSSENHWLITYSVGDKVKAKLFIHENFSGWKLASLIPEELTSNYKKINKAPDAVVFFPRDINKEQMTTWYKIAENSLVGKNLVSPVSNFLVENE